MLQLYRARWQIELLFKRVKQLVWIHRLHSTSALSTQATLAAVLVGRALLERQTTDLRAQMRDPPAPGRWMRRCSRVRAVCYWDPGIGKRSATSSCASRERLWSLTASAEYRPGCRRRCPDHQVFGRGRSLCNRTCSHCCVGSGKLWRDPPPSTWHDLAYTHPGTIGRLAAACPQVDRRRAITR